MESGSLDDNTVTFNFTTWDVSSKNHRQFYRKQNKPLQAVDWNPFKGVGCFLSVVDEVFCTCSRA